MKRAVFEPKDLRLIAEVLEWYIDSWRRNHGYIPPTLLADICKVHDKVVQEHNYLIKPVKPKKPKQRACAESNSSV